MKRLVITIVATWSLAAVTAPALAGPVTGAAIGAGAGAVVAGPPGAVVGGVAGAVIGGPNLHHRHVYRDSRGRYYWSHHRRHYY